MKTKKSNNTLRWKKWHKWIGIIITFFLFVICLSGIFLNHRKEISGVDIPRSILPEGYHFDSWNNGAAKASVRLGKDSVLLFGASGIWLTDSANLSYQGFNKGLKEGADNRMILNVVRTGSNELFAANNFNLYVYKETRWQNINQHLNCKERISNLAVQGDSLVVVSRSHLYLSLPPYTHFEKRELPAPKGYVDQVSLFRTIWLLHSGELFGIVGKLVVDGMAIVILALCITGLLITICPKLIRRKRKQKRSATTSTTTLKTSHKLHNKLGWWLFPLLIFVGGTGIFLRPPLLIAIVGIKVPPIIGSTMDSDNPWHDRLRTLRYDHYHKNWLLYSSEGFYSFDSFADTPIKEEQAPTVSVMGVTVLQQQDSLNWMVTSFSGAFLWNRETKEMIDCFTGKQTLPKKGGMPTFDKAISGYTKDLRGVRTLFSYDKEMFEMLNDTNKKPIAPMPTEIGKGRMSLWLLALECHVGRIYSPIIGKVNMMFVFLSGAFFLVLLISGFTVYKRRYRRKKKSASPHHHA